MIEGVLFVVWCAVVAYLLVTGALAWLEGNRYRALALEATAIARGETLAHVGKRWGPVWWDYPMEKAGPVIRAHHRTARYFGLTIGRHTTIGIIRTRATLEYGPGYDLADNEWALVADTLTTKAKKASKPEHG